MPVQITASDTASYPTRPGFRPIMRNGVGSLLVALSQPSGTAIHYWTSPDGTTWTDRGALSLAVAFSAIVSCQIVTISGIDSLIIVANVTGGFETWAAVLTGTALGTAQTATVTGKGPALAAYAQSSAIHVAAQNGSTVSLWHCTAGNATPINIAAPISGAFSTVSNADLAFAAPTLYLTLGDTTRGQITLVPAQLDGTGYIVSTPERAVGGMTGYHAAVCDNTAQPVICYAAAGGTTIQSVRRTGTNAYSLATTVAPSLNPANQTFSVAAVASSSTLFCAYDSASFEANGEVYLAERSSGVWSSGLLLAGGDASGYQSPRLGTVVPSGPAPDCVYLVGTGGTRALDYVSTPFAAPPLAPTNLTAGFVPGLTPTLTATYNDPAPGDPKQYSQIQVYDATGTTLIYDTGQIATTSNSWVYSGPTLTFGTTQKWRRRDWDTLSSGGSGAVGPYSALAAFTPARAGVASITDTVSAGQPASASTLYAPSFTVDFGWTQADADSTNSIRITLFEADGITVNYRTAWTALSPVVASGASGTSASVPSHAVNGASYKLMIELADATNGLVAASSLLPLTAAFIPPATPTGFTVTMFPDLGTGVAAWTLSGTDVSANLYSKKSADSAWTLVQSGVVSGTYTFRQLCCTVPYDFQVIAFDASGVPSAPAQQLNTTLGGKGPWQLTVWITDTVTGDRVCVGASDPGSPTDLAWDHIEREVINSPLGSSLPLEAFFLDDYEEAKAPLKWFLVNVYEDTTGAVRGLDTANTMYKMSQNHNPLRYTSPDGIVRYARMTQLKRWPQADHWWVSHILRTTKTPINPAF